MTSDDPEMLAKEIISGNMSVRDAEGLVKAAKPKKKGGGGLSPVVYKATDTKDVDTVALEDELSNSLGMKLEINMKDEKKGQLTIDFKTLDQLDDILHRLSQT